VGSCRFSWDLSSYDLFPQLCKGVFFFTSFFFFSEHSKEVTGHTDVQGNADKELKKCLACGYQAGNAMEKFSISCPFSACSYKEHTVPSPDGQLNGCRAFQLGVIDSPAVGRAL